MVAKSPQMPVIKAGRDVTFGDTTGQVAVGNNNVQYKDCLFILPNGSTIKAKSWQFVQGFRPVIDSTRVFGRTYELERMDELFLKHTALAITGYRGTGKSTLASMYVDRVDKSSKYAGIYWRRIEENTDIADVVGSFFVVIGKPVKKLESYQVQDLLSLLFAELDSLPYFLVFDNFETLLNPSTNEPIKAGFSELIEKAVETSGQSRILFTSWECPTSERGITVETYQIGGLDPEAAIRLMQKKGIAAKDNELEQVAKLSGGHPLALLLLAQLVRNNQESLSEALADKSLWKSEVEERILNKVYMERLSDDEQKFLQFLSIYREAVPLDAIVSIAHDLAWTTSFTKKLAFAIIRKSLLNKTDEKYWEESLIQNYVKDKVLDPLFRHKLACNYYLSIPYESSPVSKEDLSHLIEGYYHACLSLDYDRAAKIFINNLYNYLSLWGNYRTIVSLAASLIPQENTDVPPLRDSHLYGAVLTSLSHACQHLGEYKKSILLNEKAMEIAKQANDKVNEGHILVNIGIAYRCLGEYRKSLKIHQDALFLEKELGDKCGEATCLGELANASYCLAEYKKSIEYSKKALQIAVLLKDRQGEGAYLGSIGNAYLCLCNFVSAAEYFLKAYEIAKQIGDKQGKIVWLGNLAIVSRSLGKYKEAITYDEKALVVAKQVEDKQNESLSLENIGNSYFGMGDSGKAIEYYELAREIAEEIEDKKSEGTGFLNLGNAYQSLREYEKAKVHYESCLKIAQQIEDKQTESACLSNLATVLLHLGYYQDSIANNAKALKIAREIEDPHNEGVSLNNLGFALTKGKEYKEALSCYFLARELFKKLGDSERCLQVSKNIEKIRNEVGDDKFDILTNEISQAPKEILLKRSAGLENLETDDRN